jgi:hypothetical protein
VILRDEAGRATLVRYADGALVPSQTFGTVAAGFEMVGRGDLDGNGIADILWYDEAGNALAAWLLEGGTIIGGIGLATPAGEPWEAFGGADHDGDGRDEIFLRHAEAGLLRRLVLEGANFVALDELDGAPGPAWRPAGTGDLDGDGAPELVWVHEAGDVALWHFADLASIDERSGGVLPDAFAAAAVGDFHGDGLSGLLAHATDGRAEVRSPYGPQPVTPLPASLAGAAVWATGDFDGNGVADVLWRAPAEPPYELWLLDGAGGAEVLALDDPLTQTSGADPGGTASCAADLNGDGVVGMPDLALLRGCFGSDAQGGCSGADLNGDGAVGIADFQAFRSFFGGRTCSQP